MSDLIYASQYPPEQNDTYVKATSVLDVPYAPFYATDPSVSLLGPTSYTTWVSNYAIVDQRFHIDLGSSKIIKRIYYENAHYSGMYTSMGVKNFTLWGSNDADDFAELTYAEDGTWTQLTIAQTYFDSHIGADTPDPKYILVTNTTAYKYYAFKFADNYGHSLMGVRRIELQLVCPVGPLPLFRRNV